MILLADENISEHYIIYDPQVSGNKLSTAFTYVLML